ncbi:mandelate racemase/muconate lactonizing enzyme family protein [Vibrio sp. S9_S30]|uniref:mandelate racemase/muconate lactonizing enzyme family protein n=1 Tax=Vibrio sp. S9_S30 TaxID=2720226 RepID=UPI0016801A56|nr:mandelate racemase/muconate lactonizing enzyme family protein [Vibrio sp. S9_S30]MBD1556641.1 mandelate racemase/muconate lactonizing enzyme family protein [Vibrio sp. S9_S30]
MKIANIESFNLCVPIAPSKQHTSDFGLADRFETALVKITLENGLVGWGEGRVSAGSMGDHSVLCRFIDQVAKDLIGQDARAITKIWDSLYNGSRMGHALNRGHVFPIMARRGISISAISAIDIALWDLAGKALDAPIHQLLGGKRKSEMPTYGSGGWADVDHIGEQMTAFVTKGNFKTLKMRVGIQDGDPKTSARRVKAARDALGPDIEICCDAHGTFTVNEAKEFCYLVRDLGVSWFEEPVTADDVKGMAEVRSGTHIAIAAGESASTRFEFRDLIDSRAVDIVQPDLAICGGITEAKKIAALCETANLRLAPHLWTGAPAFTAGLHLIASSSAGFIVEYALGDNPLIHDLVEESFEIKNGHIRIPDAPGLGITIRESFVHQYNVKEKVA